MSKMKQKGKLARLVILLGVALSLSGSCGPWRNDDRLNVLFIIVDTLRADHLHCYGYEGIQTPHIDALASNGARFSTVVTAAPITAPSIASILTSTYPRFHGVRDNELFSLNPELPNLASVFREAGYATAGFVGAVVLDRRYGFAEGFDHYDDEMSAELQDSQRRAEKVTGAALRWLEKHARQEPFLCVVHYFDPHDPYDPPPPFSNRYSGSPYDGEIAYTDAQIGSLLAGIGEMGLDEGTLVVFVADHGEGLGEHAERTHGFFLYDSTVLVPLILHMPGLIPSGVTFESQIRTIDVMPTVLDLAGLDPPKTVQGISLAPVLKGEGQLLDRDAYVETFHTLYSYKWHELEGIRTGIWKYIRAPEVELYDLRADPDELVNLASSNTEMTSSLEASLEHMERRLGADAEPYTALRTDSDAEMLEKIRSLGYIGGSSRHDGDLPRPGGDYPDPKKGIVRLNARQEAGGHLEMATTLMLRGDFEAALEEVEAARRVAPEYAEVQATEGLILVKKGDLDEGIRLMEQAIEKDSRAQMVHQTLNNLGLAYLYKDRCDQAIDTLKRSLKAKQDYYNAMYNLGLAYEECGHRGEAVQAYETFLNADPKLDPAFLRSVRLRIENLTSSRDSGD